MVQHGVPHIYALNLVPFESVKSSPLATLACNFLACLPPFPFLFLRDTSTALTPFLSLNVDLPSKEVDLTAL